MDAKNEIGKGSFATVHKVKDKIGQVYAIKKIDLKELKEKEQSRLKKEVSNLKTVCSEFVVTYYESWKDSEYFYIKMELCSESLRNIIDRKAQVFGRHVGEPINKYEYIMSCEIFHQIVESVQYLHDLKPQIIHRDLRPENILIARNVVNKRFVKLCDFGLATVHDKTINYRSSQRHTGEVGDFDYMAPEVSSGAKYGHKCDIYSLALVARELIDIDISQGTYIKIKDLDAVDAFIS
ncbi:unnamed protein product [Oppiella nova]|uniref:Protein kinase domain-containing protein n=1 Tax=Oppiella nova TaxID=334625 RepID=A0A7R9LTT9_9ACAR|nr:unnamed protein product [Oppiella nova]CAG2166598.1 unnamed protein product [Oppiella nova]